MITPALDLSNVDTIAVAGDWHGDAEYAATALRTAAQLGVDAVVHVGDIGIGPWPSDPADMMLPALEAVLADVGLPLLVVPGNHDNYDTINAMVTDEAGMLAPTGHIRVMPRGLRWQMGAASFGALGGSFTLDRATRHPRTWWAAEVPTVQDVERLGREPLEVLITHDVPAGVTVISAIRLSPDVARCAAQSREVVREAVDATKPRLVCCGHWHQRRTGHTAHADGSETRVEVLDRECTAGNMTFLDLASFTSSVARAA